MSKHHFSPDEPSYTLSRRALLQGLAGLSVVGLPAGLIKAVLAQGAASPGGAGAAAFLSKRPPANARHFTSPAVEETIQAVKRRIGDREIAWLFENCYPNTLDTTVTYREVGGKPDTFVITGDIDAMWLRDSSAQVWPYLPLTKRDPKLSRLVQGVIRRQVQLILLDPYANAFMENASQPTQWASDYTQMKPGIHERKWEIDSLCYPIRLAYGYWKETGDSSAFDATWEKAMDTVLQTFREQQRKDGLGPYYFQRGGPKPDPQSTAPYGPPVKPIGLIYSRFRPSDDETVYPFLIPSNFFAVTSLRQMAILLDKVRHNPQKAARATMLANEVENALKQHAVVKHPRFGSIYAYEMDGLGNVLLMDDANVPSLLAMPYLGACSTSDPTYQATRRFAWSKDNLWFFQGRYSGIGGPHVGKDMIWPMSQIMHGLTSTRSDEVVSALTTLKATHAGTGFMHESFHKNNPNRFTRSWFAWANTLFGELVLQTLQRYPDVLKNELPTPVFKPVILPLPIRIAAGSDVPVAGFVPDPNASSGNTSGARVPVNTDVPNAAPEAIYQSERYGSDISFSFAVPRGKSYNVRLHFAEIFVDEPNQRIQNVQINGTQVLSNFDIFKAVGANKALVKEFTGIGPDAQGNIVIRLMSTPNSPDRNAKISGIEILNR